MNKYRKKPVVVEAMEFTDQYKDRVFHWITCNKSADHDKEGNPILRIQTLEGVMTATLGNYIIKGVNGEFYPCKPDIFHKTYEKVEEGFKKVEMLHDEQVILIMYEDAKRHLIHEELEQLIVFKRLVRR